MISKLPSNTRSFFLAAIFLLSLSVESDAQIWTKIYWHSSGQKYDGGKSIIQVDSGSFIVAGGHLGNLVKIDKNGDIIWRKSYEEIEQANDLTLTSDGGICLIGYNYTTSKGWLIKTTPFGKKVWSKSFDGIADVSALLENLEGGLSILSNKLTLTDAQGNIIKQIAGVPKSTRFIQLPSSQYVICPNGGTNMMMLTADGVKIWEKPLAGARSVATTSDGNLVVMGYNDVESVIYLTKWDLNGNEIWYKTYPQLDVRPYQFLWNKMVRTKDDELAFIAYADGFNAFIAKTDANGNLICARTQELNNMPVVLNNLIATSDNGFALVGTRNGINDGEDLFIMKTDSICQTSELEVIYVEKGEVETVYSDVFSYKYGPNPCQGHVVFEIQPTKPFDGKMMLVFYDALGRVAKSETILNGNLTIFTDGLPGGMYFFKIFDNGKELGKGKIAVQR